MTLHKSSVSVAQMIDAMDAAIQHVGRLSRVQLEADPLRRDAVLRALQVVGEAARRVPVAVVKEHAEIDWSGWIGLRNRLTHGYDTINYGLVWTVVNEDIPKARPALQTLQATLHRKGL